MFSCDLCDRIGVSETKFVDVPMCVCVNMIEHTHLVHNVLSFSSQAEYNRPIEDVLEYDWYAIEDLAQEGNITHDTILTIGEARWFGVKGREADEIRKNQRTTAFTRRLKETSS